MAAIQFKSSAQTSFDDANRLFQLAAEQGNAAFNNLNTAATTVGEDYKTQNNAFIQNLIAAQSQEDLKNPKKQQFFRMDLEDHRNRLGGMVDMSKMYEAADQRVTDNYKQEADIETHANELRAAQQEYATGEVALQTARANYEDLPEVNRQRAEQNAANLAATNLGIKIDGTNFKNDQSDYSEGKDKEAQAKLFDDTYQASKVFRSILDDPKASDSQIMDAENNLVNILDKSGLSPADVQRMQDLANKEASDKLTAAEERAIKLGEFNLKKQNTISTVNARDSGAVDKTLETNFKITQPVAGAGSAAQVSAVGESGFTTDIYVKGTTQIDPSQFQNQVNAKIAEATSNAVYGDKSESDFGQYQSDHKLEGVEPDQLVKINKVLAEGDLSARDRIVIWQGMVNGSFKYTSLLSSDKSSYQKQIVEYLKDHQNVRGAEQTAATKKVYLDGYSTVLKSTGSGGIKGYLEMLGVDKGGFEDYALLPKAARDYYGVPIKEYEKGVEKFKIKESVANHGGPSSLDEYYTFTKTLSPNEQAIFKSKHPETVSVINYYGKQAVEASNAKGAALDKAAANHKNNSRSNAAIRPSVPSTNQGIKRPSGKRSRNNSR